MIVIWTGSEVGGFWLSPKADSLDPNLCFRAVDDHELSLRSGKDRYEIAAGHFPEHPGIFDQEERTDKGHSKAEWK
jgi:hypothetical protein